MSEHVLPPARHEAGDVGFAPMAFAGALMLVALAALALLALWLYPASTRDKVNLQPLHAAGPVLQPDPAADMRAFRAAKLDRLNGVGWVDQERGSVHIPIGQAMRDVARAGIPDWPSAPRRPAP